MQTAFLVLIPETGYPSIRLVSRHEPRKGVELMKLPYEDYQGVEVPSAKVLSMHSVNLPIQAGSVTPHSLSSFLISDASLYPRWHSCRLRRVADAIASRDLAVML